MLSLPEDGQLFRVKINQKSHFTAVELLLDLWSVLCPPNSSRALLGAVWAGRDRSFVGTSVGSVLLGRELRSLPRDVGAVNVPELLWGLWDFFLLVVI